MTFCAYTNCMEITFDPAKDAANIAKHGYSLSEARSIDWDSALVRDDDRADYGEHRQRALGVIGNRGFFVAFVEREGLMRVISLRKANKREVSEYVANS